MNNNLRKQSTGYTNVKNKLLNHKKISLKAKGLYAFMCSKPEKWNFTIRSMATQLKEGSESIRAAINELKEFGYLEYSKNNDGSGIYYLFNDPKPRNPNVGYTTMVKPDPFSNKDLNSNKDDDDDDVKDFNDIDNDSLHDINKLKESYLKSDRLLESVSKSLTKASGKKVSAVNIRPLMDRFIEHLESAGKFSVNKLDFSKHFREWAKFQELEERPMEIDGRKVIRYLDNGKPVFERKKM